VPSVTTWTRLEPRSRSEDMRPALEARVHDPLWLLARQWLTGEFRGQDVGSPVQARLRASVARLTRYRPGATGAPRDYDPRTTPLEAMVEAEPASPRTEPRLAVDAGVQFLRLLRQLGAGDTAAGYRSEYPLAPPSASSSDNPATLRYRTLMARRVPDGLKLRAAFAAAAPGLPARPAVPSARRAKVRAAVAAWTVWFDRRRGPVAGDDAWSAERMEYSFAVARPTR
jgi:hypothetical protein